MEFINEKSYKYMFQNADELFSYLYHSKEKDIDKIYELVCKTQYYSIESYYTPCTVNVVVLLLQGNFKLKSLNITKKFFLPILLIVFLLII